MIALALAACVLAPASAQAELPSKQVAAPASDILSGLVRLSDPAASATRSRAAVVPVELAWRAGDGWSFQTRLPVERAGSLAVALLSPDAARWRLRARLPGGEELDLGLASSSQQVERRTQVLAQDLPGWIVDRYDLPRAPQGLWTFTVDVPQAGADERPAEGWLIARDESPLALSCHATTLALLADQELGLVAHVFDAGRVSASPLVGLVHSAQAFVETSAGARTLPMLDDGRHQDGAAGDGVFGTTLPRWTTGDVRARIELTGRVPLGGAFLRTAQIAFPVLERRLLLDGSVVASLDDPQRLMLDLGAWPLGPAAKLHVSAEVWGTDAEGQAVPVCWLSRMLQPEARGERWILPLWLDLRWLDVAAAEPPLELRGIRVQDPDTHVLFDVAESLPFDVPLLPPRTWVGSREITPEMLMGPLVAAAPPATSAGPHAAATHAPFKRALMLVHGYCSGGSVWPAADFTQPKLSFLDPNANRTHDQFAQLLAQQGGSLTSFGVVGHSQGGPAALHLYTYYTSPLDKAFGGRRIQSVGSPYQGTPLASLGAFACGVNNDMTPAGSTAWLAGIPSWARAEVSYWTTSDAGSACNFLTSLFLTDPEDGTVEKFRGELPGGNAMGHVTGWCHTTGMSYPAQYTDHARNVQMNAAAAR